MSRIVATGAYYPEKIVTNDFFSAPPPESELPPIAKFIAGMRERRHAQPHETGIFMAVEAARRAIDNSDFDFGDIDLILGNVVPNENLYPEDLFLIAGQLGCNNATLRPLNTACSTFLTALQTADLFIASQQRKLAMIVYSVNWVNTIFDKSMDISTPGDGAAAVILDNTGDSLLSYKERCDFRVFHTMNMKSPVFTHQDEYFSVTEDPQFDMIEEQVIKPISVASELLAEHPDIEPDWFIAHQAGLPMLETWRRQLKLSKDKLLHTFDKFANMTATNIPVTLDHYVRSGKIKRGDKILFFAPSAGAHYISILWKY
ncbi:MAG: 3-oxoacyl-[acyl-carrier-protein] synthase III C-terminal domain-containing protein [Methylococcales bacterium]